MGFRGVIRDLLGFFIGSRLVLSVVSPLAVDESVIFGALLLFFSAWFTLERFGILKK